MKYLIIIMTMFLSGCLILLDEDCDPYSVDYSTASGTAILQVKE